MSEPGVADSETGEANFFATRGAVEGAVMGLEVMNGGGDGSVMLGNSGDCFAAKSTTS